MLIKMVKSKTKISKQTERKTNSVLVETINATKKHKPWLKVSSILSGPRKKRFNANLMEIKDNVVVPGKVLSLGEASKNKIVALAFSEKAKEKIIKAGGKAIIILEEIKSNPEMKGLKLLIGNKK